MLCRRPQPQRLVDCRANVAGSVRRKPAATVSSTARSHLITEPEKFDLTTGARSPDRELPGPFHQPTISITSISAPRAWPPRRTAHKAPAVQGRGKLAERIEVRIRLFRSASHRAEPFLVALPTSLGLVHLRQRFAPHDHSAGAKVLGKVRHPFPGDDFSSFLLQAKASK